MTYNFCVHTGCARRKTEECSQVGLHNSVCSNGVDGQPPQGHFQRDSSILQKCLQAKENEALEVELVWCFRRSKRGVFDETSSRFLLAYRCHAQERKASPALGGKRRGDGSERSWQIDVKFQEVGISSDNEPAVAFGFSFYLLKRVHMGT